MFFSEDGGKTWKTDRIQKIHGDYHALWINPANSDHMFVGSDGGIHLTWDGGRTMGLRQHRAPRPVLRDQPGLDTPYRVCGGLQDNGSWCGPSRTLDPRGISNEDWFRVGGGDGFYTVVDPADPDIVYAESQDGNLRALRPPHEPDPDHPPRSTPRASATASTGTRPSSSPRTTTTRSTTGATGSSARRTGARPGPS